MRDQSPRSVEKNFLRTFCYALCAATALASTLMPVGAHAGNESLMVIKKPPYKTITITNAPERTNVNTHPAMEISVSPAPTENADAIVSSDVAAVKRNDYGVDASIYGDKFSLAQVNPTTLEESLAEIPARIHVELIKDVWAAILTRPVDDTLVKALPKDWTAQALTQLQLMGQWDALDALLMAVPEPLYDEPFYRERLRRLITGGKLQEACSLSDDVTTRAITAEDGLWAQMHVFCLRNAGNASQADIALSLLAESAPNTATPLLNALVEDDAGTSLSLPKMKPVDVKVSAFILAAVLLNESRRDSVLHRVAPDFLDDVNVERVPAMLARELLSAPKLSAQKRVQLAEKAMESGVAPAVVLRGLYHSLVVNAESQSLVKATAKTSDDKPSKDAKPSAGAANNVLQRAQSYEAVANEPNKNTKAQLLAESLPLFYEAMPIQQTGELFAAEFASISEGGIEASALPMHVALAAMRHHLSHHYRPAALSLLHIIQKDSPSVSATAASTPNTLAVMSVLCEQALRLDDASNAVNAGAATMVAMPVLKDTITLTDAWAMRRLIAVMEALGQPIDNSVQTVIEHIEPAETVPFDEHEREFINQVLESGSQVDKTLAALSLLGSGRLDILSDDTIAMAIKLLHTAGLDRAAYTLARDAILLPPHL